MGLRQSRQNIPTEGCEPFDRVGQHRTTGGDDDRLPTVSTLPDATAETQVAAIRHSGSRPAFYQPIFGAERSRSHRTVFHSPGMDWVYPLGGWSHLGAARKLPVAES